MHGVPCSERAGVPAIENTYDDGETGGLGRYMVNRHSGYVGSSFLDGSARKIGLKGMLKVKWNRQYDTNKWYEIQEDIGWPEWMQNFKDY